MRSCLAIFTFAIAACSSNSTDAPVDAAIDGASSVCDTCTADQICIARYDGTCIESIACVARTVDCPANACSPACEAAYCTSPYQCHIRPGCGGEPPTAFTCYGP